MTACALLGSSEPSRPPQSKLSQRKNLLGSACLLRGPVSVTTSFGNNLSWECYKYHLSDEYQERFQGFQALAL